MQLFVLPSVLHGGEVHSVDIDNSNTHLLSAGKDGSVSVWSVEKLRTAPLDEKPVHTFNLHQHLVVLAKWCPTNNNFISCDEKGVVILTNFGDKSTQTIYPFPAHADRKAAVVDGCWSPSGTLFAWSTADGKIHLYDVVKKTYQELTSLDHAEAQLSFRSLAFDPSSNFLVALADETMIYLYQYHERAPSGYQFRLLSKISKLLNKTPVNVKYKRISWSSDGEFVSIPTASKNETSLISLISRSQNWSNKVSLVGHDMTCEVVRFNPQIFTSIEPEPVAFYMNPTNLEKNNIFHVIATAGSDRTLCVWNTTKESPIFVIKDVVLKPIVDLCWDNLGTSLFMASLDGSLAVVNFESSELGKNISAALNDQLKEFASKSILPVNHKYEIDGVTNKKTTSTQQVELLDQKNALKYEQQQVSAKKTETEQPKVEVVEEKLKPKKVKGNIVPEVLEASQEPENDVLASTMNNRQTKPKAKKAPVKPVEPKITTKNGKKRIQPMLISKASDTPPVPLPKSFDMNGSEPKSFVEFEKPSYSVSEEVVKEKRRIKGAEENASKKPKRDLEPVKFIGPAILNPNVTFAKVRLAVPKVRFHFRVPSKQEEFALDIRNGQGNESVPTRVTYFKKDKQVWCDFIPRYIHLATEGSNFWALATVDGQILSYSHVSGKRILPPMVLGTPLSFLESHGKFLMAVTSVGEVYVWDLEAKKLHLSTPLSLGPLLELSSKFQEDGLSKSESLTMCSITSLGIPLVTLSNGSGYLYNKDLGTWQTISESWWAFGSHYWDSLNEEAKPQTNTLLGESSIVRMLEHKTNEEILRKTRTGRGKYFNKISKNIIMKEGFENLENTISLSHLENRILCCELLGEFSDFKNFLIIYAKRVGELGLKAKLYDICNQLLGPADATEWVSEICGMDKHKLLKEIILACAMNRDCQRVLIHFGRQVGLVEDDLV